MLYQVDAPHYCAGFIVEAGRVVHAAPIIAWAVGKTHGEVERYFRRKGFKVTQVEVKPQKIAIVGSRDYKNLASVKAYVFALPAGTIIVSGGARGVDRAGELAAMEAGFAVKIFFPDWREHGKAAGHVRNALIVKEADKIVVFWDGKSPGTMHVLALARASGKPVELYVCRRAPIGGSDNPGVLQRLPRAPGAPALPVPSSPAQAAARARRGRG